MRQLDIVPFGGIERRRGEIAWPPWWTSAGPKHVSAWNRLWIEEWIVRAASRSFEPCRSDMKKRVDYWKP